MRFTPIQVPPRSPVIRLNEYNKLTEYDDLFIHRRMQQRCGFYDSIQESDCLCVDNYSGGDMHRSCYSVDIKFVQNF